MGLMDRLKGAAESAQAARSRGLLLLVAVACLGALAAGCGGSSSSSTTSSAPAATSTAAPPTTSSTAAVTTSGSSASANPAVAQAVAACKSRIDSASQLSASVKTKLDNLCNQAASGNEASARKAAAQVCQEIIKATVPQAAQTQALSSCPKA
jgi:hypothetical protein